MDSNDTQKLPLRLLLNAEPFGFGPTAAIAGFFPHLRGNFATIGYMGKKHTLDLQKGLPYDAIHDVTGTPKDERSENYAPVFAPEARFGRRIRSIWRYTTQASVGGVEVASAEMLVMTG